MASVVSHISAIVKAKLVVELGEHTDLPGPIVRVQGSGQYRLALDQQLAEAVQAHDEQRFHDLLIRIIALVQAKGSSIGPEQLVPSETILPPNTLTLEEAHALLHASGTTLPSHL